MKGLFYKIVAAVFAILFSYAVYVQNNDPDAIQWYFYYGTAVVVSILFIVNKLPYYVAAALVIVYLVGAIVVWPDHFEGVAIGEGDIVNIERGREALGLLIVAFIMLVYTLVMRANSKKI